MPIPAPAKTSPVQCRLLATLKIPVAVANANPEVAYKILLLLYSKNNKVALLKAIAVCPEGKEFLALFKS